MLRFIDIHKDGKTTTERFPLDLGSLWLAKREEKYGVSLDKHDAISELANTVPYAQRGKPNYMVFPGDQISTEIIKNVVSLPGANRFVQSLLTFELKQAYQYDVVYCEDYNSVAIICKPALNKNKDYFVIYAERGYIPDQVRRCIYQLYIEYDKGIDFDLKIKDTNSKQREWLSYWYKRLPARGFTL